MRVISNEDDGGERDLLADLVSVTCFEKVMVPVCEGVGGGVMVGV